MALEPCDDVGFVEVVADEAEAALGVKLIAVEGDDAGSLLAAVLQGVKAERGDGRRIGVAENTEDPAFLAKAIVADAASNAAHWHPGPSSLMAGLPLKRARLHQDPPSRSGTRVRWRPLDISQVRMLAMGCGDGVRG